jgi:hypothetical protein
LFSRKCCVGVTGGLLVKILGPSRDEVCHLSCQGNDIEITKSTKTGYICSLRLQRCWYQLHLFTKKWKGHLVTQNRSTATFTLGGFAPFTSYCVISLRWLQGSWFDMFSHFFLLILVGRGVLPWLIGYSRPGQFSHELSHCHSPL